MTLLAFEKRYDQKKAQKTAKRLLKQQKTDLYLWNGYAQLEKASGNLAECRKVYFTALTLSADFPAEDAVGRPLLFRLFAELELEQMHRDKSLAIYVSMADGKFMENVDFLSEQDPTTTVSPSRLLKTKNVWGNHFFLVKSVVFSSSLYIRNLRSCWSSIRQNCRDTKTS